MIQKLLMACLFVATASSCGLFIRAVSVASTSKITDVDTEGRTDVPSPYNEDNVIFKTNRAFVYAVDQLQKGRYLRFKIEMLVIPGSFNSKETRIKYNYYYNPADLDPLEL